MEGAIITFYVDITHNTYDHETDENIKLLIFTQHIINYATRL